MNQRLSSLDIFRGITLFGMILVNTPGNGDYSYGPLRHADWHGFTPTDLVFPSFLFMVGMAMYLSFKKFNFTLSPDLRNKILKRTALLFLVNYFIFYFPFLDFSLSNLRILNVLPRIALSYCIVSFIVLSNKRSSRLWVINWSILLAYWLIMYLFGDSGDPYSLTGNAARKLDLLVIGENHLYHGEGIAFDPEGILSTLPALSTCLFGYMTMEYIDINQEKSHKILNRLMAWGMFLFLLAQIWHFAFPINKKLWTSSFVINCVGLDLMLIGLLYWWVDIKGRNFGKDFFKVFGMNSILAYGVSEILIIQLYNWRIADGDGYLNFPSWTYWNIFQPVFGYSFGSLVSAISYVMICWGICYIFYKRKIFLKL